ncbi:Nif3-like dinuclear metal center hexameric protein [Micromonospora globispora]|uniref:Nif3-like dinuclear metal center hexameric protein n=1 Tax=Micromonospora globispora TaxID=1450148 RepID=UPI000D700425|nr:Nif3-like dinuclear metal center hexameric protein [Micromonospora globispora]PWU55982.1 Nif3-like dinuclear metal center hexameric protein [Micromonospora globispora]
MSTTESGPTVADVVVELDRRYPPAWAEEWDRIGLVLGEPDAPVRRVACVVDVVPETVDEALAAGADLIVAHHPLLLRGVSSVAATTYKGRIVHRLIKADVALYVAHTNADVADPGVSDALAARTPHAVAGDPGRMVRTLAVSGGSGDSFLAEATAAGVDAFLTADLRHHPAGEHLAAGGPALLDAAHWATERPWLDDLAADLRAALGVETVVSDLDTDPWTVHATAPRVDDKEPRREG